MIVTCQSCGAPFEARSTAKYCSNACRQRAYRERGCSAPMRVAPPRAVIGKIDAEEAVCRAHQAAADLSRASAQAPAPLCLSLDRAARAIEAALRGEGL